MKTNKTYCIESNQIKSNKSSEYDGVVTTMNWTVDCDNGEEG
jgi:hypothetical protein